MGKIKREWKAITLRLKPEDFERLQRLVEMENEPVSDIIRRAVRRELDRCKA